MWHHFRSVRALLGVLLIVLLQPGGFSAVSRNSMRGEHFLIRKSLPLCPFFGNTRFRGAKAMKDIITRIENG